MSGLCEDGLTQLRMKRACPAAPLLCDQCEYPRRSRHSLSELHARERMPMELCNPDALPVTACGVMGCHLVILAHARKMMHSGEVGRQCPSPLQRQLPTYPDEWFCCRNTQRLALAGQADGWNVDDGGTP